jgi:hypothetical protein
MECDSVRLRAANIRWRYTVKALESAIEIRQVTEAAIEGDARNASVKPPSISEHAVRLQKPAGQHIF